MNTPRPRNYLRRTTIRRLFPFLSFHLRLPSLHNSTIKRSLQLPIWTIGIAVRRQHKSRYVIHSSAYQIISKTIRFPCLCQTQLPLPHQRLPSLRSKSISYLPFPYQHIALDVANLTLTPTKVQHFGHHPPGGRAHVARLPSPFNIDTYFPNTPSTTTVPRPPPHTGASTYLVPSLRLAQTTTFSAN